jgi:hypothetical protein
VAVFEPPTNVYRCRYTELCLYVLVVAVLMLLTLVTYWMDPTETDRLLLATVDVLSHILFLQHLGRLLPANGDQTPLISKNSL